VNGLPIPPPNEPVIIKDPKGDRVNDNWWRYWDSNALSKYKRVLTEDTTFSVRASTGSDTNGTGTFGQPFATPQGAYDYCVANIDANGFFVKIRMVDTVSTTYTSTSKRRTTDEFSSDTTVLTLNVRIQNCPCVEFEAAGFTGPDYSTNRIKWDANGGNCVFLAAEGGLFRFQGIAFIDSAVSKGTLFFANNNCTFSFQNCDFGAAGDYQVHIGPGSVMKIFADNSISGGATYAWAFLEQGALADHEISDMLITNTPAYANGFIWCLNQSQYAFISATVTGSATGPRYRMENSTISGSTALDSFLPGSTSGVAILDINGEARVQANRVGPLDTGTDALAFVGESGGRYGNLVQVKNQGTFASALYFTSAGPTVTKIAGDASMEASTAPAGGNSGFAWDGGSSSFRVYNNTGLTRTYAVLSHWADD
jgi:hypothetical protein